MNGIIDGHNILNHSPRWPNTFDLCAPLRPGVPLSNHEPLGARLTEIQYHWHGGSGQICKGEPKRGKRPSRHHPPSGFSGIRAISHNRRHCRQGRLPPPGGPTRTPTGAPPPPCGRPGPPPSPTAARCAAGGSSAVGRPPPEGGGLEGGGLGCFCWDIQHAPRNPNLTSCAGFL